MHSMPRPSFHPDLICAAADASADIYAPDASNFEYWRKVEQFRLVGELAAAVRFTDDRKTAFIAIRGTSLWGNWLFTNFQAYFAAFTVVDETLSAAPATKYQGGQYRTPIPGALHQGFYRAFSWLWYGTEPMFAQTGAGPEYWILSLVALLLTILSPTHRHWVDFPISGGVPSRCPHPFRLCHFRGRRMGRHLSR